MRSFRSEPSSSSNAAAGTTAGRTSTKSETLASAGAVFDAAGDRDAFVERVLPIAQRPGVDPELRSELLGAQPTVGDVPLAVETQWRFASIYAAFP